MDTSDLTSRGYGAVLWEPDQQTVHDARITRFMRWLADRGHDFADYADLWRWSVTDPASGTGADRRGHARRPMVHRFLF
jgi:hypothetical protein